MQPEKRRQDFERVRSETLAQASGASPSNLLPESLSRLELRSEDVEQVLGGGLSRFPYGLVLMARFPHSQKARVGAEKEEQVTPPQKGRPARATRP